MSTHEPRLTGTKVCSKCERELPVICFAVEAKHSDGLQSQCRDCLSEKNRQWYKEKKKPMKVLPRKKVIHLID